MARDGEDSHIAMHVLAQPECARHIDSVCLKVSEWSFCRLLYHNSRLQEADMYYFALPLMFVSRNVFGLAPVPLCCFI